jgi:hypothetical protein
MYVDFDKIISIGSTSSYGGFSECTALYGEINLEQCLSIGKYAFKSCKNIESVIFSENLTLIDS